MKINGFRIQQDIREAQEERNLLSERFEPALYRFPNEPREDLQALAERISELEDRIAQLQTAQVRFNSAVTVTVEGRQQSLLFCIKQLGGLDRLVNLWRTASKDGTRDSRRRGYYGQQQLARPADQVVAERTISVEAADELRRQARKRSTTLRAAIQQGNAQELDSAEIGYPLK